MCHVIQAQFSLDSDPHLKQGWGSSGLRPRRDQAPMVSILGFFLFFFFVFFGGEGGTKHKLGSPQSGSTRETIGNSWD